MSDRAELFCHLEKMINAVNEECKTTGEQSMLDLKSGLKAAMRLQGAAIGEICKDLLSDLDDDGEFLWPPSAVDVADLAGFAITMVQIASIAWEARTAEDEDKANE